MNNLPATLSRLTFDTYDLQRSDLQLHLDVVDGLNDGLEVRGEDTTVPGLAGRIPRNRMPHQRTIRLEGWLLGHTHSDAQGLLDDLTDVFAPEGDPATLLGVAADGSSRSIEARTSPPGLILGAEIVPGVRQVAVSLISVDPYWTSPS